MTAILGLNAFHPDASACLVVDGKLVGAVAEERLGARRKHTMEFPQNAIRWVLQDAGLRLRDVTHVAIARNPGANLAAKTAHLLRNPSLALGAAARHLTRKKSMQASLGNLAEICGEDPQKVRYKLHAVEHHLAHIASAYYLSPFEALTAGFSYDGSGDFASAMAARCEGPRIDVLKRRRLPDSLGHFYTAMCQFIGFDRFGEEYKVMGLAPYGEDRFDAALSRLLGLDATRWFRLNPAYFDIARGFRDARFEVGGEMRLGRIYSDKLVDLLGSPRTRSQPIGQREMDIARSTQTRFEAAATQVLRDIGTRVPLTRLAMAGGSALNGVMNARILRDFPVDQMYLQAAASDDGTAIGAAYHCWHMGMGREARFEMTHAFWGPEYPDWRIRQAIEAAGLRYHTCRSEAELVALAADYIAEGAVVGWYQGRAEWGPRALGNRSILANPAIADMKATINRKIKKRESFRPFAPSVLREEVGRFFEQDIESPFMMHVVKFKPKWRKRFPAVTHVDGTGRLQSVDAANNPLYYKLISAIKARTGYGIVLNTSFNENEPIVDTPEQAISVYARTEMDVLVLGNHVLVKPEYGGRR
ncbi:carbamoyltransferase C-terminal domain-containing protein [Maritimibacter sp. HL-12]|uniref:carbamoyltransferase family protein n=1 Tax=Maritimibacter sp. HL-12 TaxID=1162418 RepID=UPI000A0EEB93|nr:carbamoyltransferase C-terminal domain-containing protein [Maritimibacter sp. HL-12]SMH55481.1 carbamoyltransferase [Maritimibacter sp. HL-12]